MEIEERRKELKRKGEDGKGGGRRKRTKLPRLEEWGEKEEGGTNSPVKEPETKTRMGNVDFQLGTILSPGPVEIPKNTAKQNTVVTDGLVELETRKMMDKGKKMMDSKLKMSKTSQKKKFQFQSKGKLKEEEIQELKRTHAINIFSWVSRDTAIRLEQEVQMEIETEMEVDCQEAQLERQSRLERMERRKGEFRTRRMCLDLLDDMMEDVTKYRSKEMSICLLEEVMVDVWEEVAVNSLFINVKSFGSGVRRQLMERLRREEERNRMLERQSEQKKAWQIKLKG